MIEVCITRVTSKELFKCKAFFVVCKLRGYQNNKMRLKNDFLSILSVESSLLYKKHTVTINKSIILQQFINAHNDCVTMTFEIRKCGK